MTGWETVSFLRMCVSGVRCDAHWQWRHCCEALQGRAIITTPFFIFLVAWRRAVRRYWSFQPTSPSTNSPHSTAYVGPIEPVTVTMLLRRTVAAGRSAMLLTWIERIGQAANGELRDLVARRSFLQKYHKILQLTDKFILFTNIREFHAVMWRQPSDRAFGAPVYKYVLGNM